MENLRQAKLWNLGKLSYDKALKIQNSLARLHLSDKSGILDTLLLVEHSPVYTIGIRTQGYTEEEIVRLKATGASFYKTNRGGLITYHGPGQLVAYPIFNLRNYKSSMRWYVSNLESTVIDLCRKFELDAQRSPHTGVWIGHNKLCAIGVHGSKFVTTHGLALNCNTDLRWFDHIVPCGIVDKGVTSLSKELRRLVDINTAVPLFLESFAKVFDCAFIDFPEEEKEDFLDIIKHEYIKKSVVQTNFVA